MLSIVVLYPLGLAVQRITRPVERLKFVVIASDALYPTGAMKDYEANFYLPLKGMTKPVYAIPGNHDWFNALDGFAANLMEPGRSSNPPAASSSHCTA